MDRKAEFFIMNGWDIEVNYKSGEIDKIHITTLDGSIGILVDSLEDFQAIVEDLKTIGRDLGK